MITLQKTDYQQMEQAAADAGVTPPIEHTDVWARFQADIPGRPPVGVV
ncbi:peptidoglycan bridge formation protein FemAB, partial [Bifidobacterium bifidum]